MIFRKKLFQSAALGLLLILPSLAGGAVIKISGRATTSAIDTLTLSGSLAGNAAVPTAMVIFTTFIGNDSDATRDSIVNDAAGLTTFSIDQAGPGQFSVEDSTGNQNVTVKLRGQVIGTHSEEGEVTSNAGQDFVLIAASIPTLSEWGLVIFGALLLAGLVWFIHRKRRLAKVTA